ncbi:hypothetical protein [Hymenobacter sp.]|uniref:hypothetical protein n=1 Tax=Hymenobacter sp. TaxID=1898978 RepID=UPI00286BDD1D|nr:hypothetical protein [Hymenobacter sp.]
MKNLHAAALLLLLCACGKEKEVTPTPNVPDSATGILVSDARAQIGDPEFDPYTGRICWQSITDHKIWVCAIDPVTGKLAVANGQQTLVDGGDVVPLTATFNAGEWAFSRAGAAIVYTKNSGGSRYVAVATETGAAGTPGATWALNTLMTTPNRFLPRATKNPNDNVAAFQCATSPGTSTTKYKFFDNPGTEFSIASFSDAHWADDEQVLTGILPNNQVGLFNPANPTAAPVQLTQTSGTTYSRPYMWRAPDQGNARMFFAKANGNEIQVFKETAPGSNAYAPFQQFRCPSTNPAYPNIGSPEPVIYKGKSYITFMASSSPLETTGGPAEIWLATVSSTAPAYKMVSDNSVRARTDPEPYPTAAGLYIYYTEVDDAATPDNVLDPTTILRVRRCETGL